MQRSDFCHVTREEEALRDLIRPIVKDILDSQLAFQIFAVITPQIDPFNKKNFRSLRCCHVPPHLSKNEGLRLNDVYSHRLDTHEVPRHLRI